MGSAVITETFVMDKKRIEEFYESYNEFSKIIETNASFIPKENQFHQLVQECKDKVRDYLGTLRIFK